MLLTSAGGHMGVLENANIDIFHPWYLKITIQSKFACNTNMRTWGTTPLHIGPRLNWKPGEIRTSFYIFLSFLSFSSSLSTELQFGSNHHPVFLLRVS